MIKKVVCGISGGVDSAVAAYLLKRQGMEVTGVFMKNWDRGDEGGECSGETDEEDAALVCKSLDIPFIKVDFVKQYWNEVFSHFVSDYTKGLTPNPDVLCNKHIKFGHFHHHCLHHLGVEAVATGHYANHSYGQFGQLRQENENAKLLRSTDPSKDQTLFLSQISQEALQTSLFPLGAMMKVDVKKIARKIGLQKIANKKESTGICFIGKRNFKEFIAQYHHGTKGQFVDMESGKVVGEHSGVHQFTKGQRTLIGGLKQAYFVVDRDPATQAIHVVPGSNHPALFTRSFLTSHGHWINEDPFGQHKDALRLQFRFQHTHLPIDCEVTPLGGNEEEEGGGGGTDSCDIKWDNNKNNINNNPNNYVNKSNSKNVKLSIKLSQALRAVAPGQYATLYRGHECLGSSVIQRMSLPSIHKYSSSQGIKANSLVSVSS